MQWDFGFLPARTGQALSMPHLINSSREQTIQVRVTSLVPGRKDPHLVDSDPVSRKRADLPFQVACFVSIIADLGVEEGMFRRWVQGNSDH